MTEYVWEINEILNQDEMIVASGSSESYSDAEKEMLHYAMMYSRDAKIRATLIKTVTTELSNYVYEKAEGMI